MQIRPITKDDISKVVDTMVDSFFGEDLYICFCQNEGNRKIFLKAFMKFRLKYGIKSGKVYVTDDCKGVAIWISPYKIMKPADLFLLGGMGAMLKCNSKDRKNIMAFNNYSDKIASENISQPYWHLSPICVANDMQGKGYGKALIEYGLAEIKNSGHCCFLETQTIKNKNFYLKNAFETLSETTVPKLNIKHIAMVYKCDK